MSIDLSTLLLGPGVFGLRKYRDAIANYGISGAPTVCFCGDSNSMGEGAGDVGGLDNASYYSIPRVLARKLGWQDGSVFGTQNLTDSAAFFSFDPRTNPGSFVPGALAMFGKFPWTSPGVSTQPFSFSPTNLSDTIDVHIVNDPGAYGHSSVTITIDGVDVETFSTITTASLVVKRYTKPLGVHTVSISTNGTGTFYLMGISTYNTANPAPVLIINSHGSGKLAEINASVYSSSSRYFLVNNIKPDLTILLTGINDIAVPTAHSAYGEQIADFCDVVYGGGSDVFNCLSFACLNGTTPVSNRLIYASYRARNREIAEAFDGAFYDSRMTTGYTHTKAIANGYVYNTNHMNRAGYEQCATELFDMLKRYGQW